MVDILRAACRGAQMPAGIVLVVRLIGGVHMAELIVPDGLPVTVAILGQHHDNRAALADTVLTIQIAQRNGDDQLALVVRFAVQIRRFQMYHGGVFCDTLLTVFVQKLNVIQRLAEIILQRFVSADVQYIFTAVIVSIIASEHQIAFCRIIKHHGFLAVAVKVTRRDSGIALGVVAAQLAHPAVSVVCVRASVLDTAAAAKLTRMVIKYMQLHFVIVAASITRSTPVRNFIIASAAIRVISHRTDIAIGRALTFIDLIAHRRRGRKLRAVQTGVIVARTEYAAARAFQNARFVKIVHAAAIVIAARLQDTDLLGGVQIALDVFAVAKGLLAVVCFKAVRCRQIKSVFIRCGSVFVVRQRYRRQHTQAHRQTQKERKSLFTQAGTCRDIWDFICHFCFLIFSPPWSLFPAAFAAIRQVVPVFSRNTAAWRCARHRCPPRISSLQCRTTGSRNVPAGSESR